VGSSASGTVEQRDEMNQVNCQAKQYHSDRRMARLCMFGGWGIGEAVMKLNL